MCKFVSVLMALIFIISALGLNFLCSAGTLWLICEAYGGPYSLKMIVGIWLLNTDMDCLFMLMLLLLLKFFRGVYDGE